MPQKEDEIILEKKFNSTRRNEVRTSVSRKDAIVQASIKLFLEQGYCNTTLRQIASATDTSPSLITYYFGTKQAIAHTFLKAKMKELRRELMQRVDIRTEPELFCCTTIRLFQTVMSSPGLYNFYHDMIEERLFHEFFFSGDDELNASILILSKRNIQLSPKKSVFYSHYIAPSIEMALWLSADDGIPDDEMLDVPFRAFMGLIYVPQEEVEAYCRKAKEIVTEILTQKPELLDVS